MKESRLSMLLLIALASLTTALGESAVRPPVKVFLDTDVCVDAGDLAALAMMHGLAGAGEIEILGVTCVTSNPDAPGCVDAVNRWYGRPDIPVGALKGPAFLEKSDYSESIAKMWPNRYQRGTAVAPDATTPFRQIIARQPDGCVVLVSIGPLRNLRRFLESGAVAGIQVRLSADRTLGWPIDANADIYYQGTPTKLRAQDLNDKVVHLTLWHYAPANRDCLHLAYGLDFHGAQTNPTGYRSAFPTSTRMAMAGVTPWSTPSPGACRGRRKTRREPATRWRSHGRSIGATSRGVCGVGSWSKSAIPPSPFV